MRDPVVEIVFESGGAELVFRAEDFPVSIGGGERDDIQLPHPAARETVALASVLDGQAFVQSGKSNQPAYVNDELLVGSRRLESEDEIRIGSSRLICGTQPGRIVLRLIPASRAAAAHESGRDEIIPVRFRPKGGGPEAPVSRLRPALVAVWGGGAFLLALVWFSFAAVSVQLTLEPEADEISWPETLLKVPFGQRYLVRPGDHAIVAEKEGYFPLEERIVVDSGGGQSFVFALAKRPGLLRVQTKPADGVAVLVDGEPAGQTPLAPVELAAGGHRLELRAPRYQAHQSEIEIEGRGMEQTVEIELSPAWAEITLNSSPEEASVWIDGLEVGRTRGTFEVLEGQRVIELRLQGHKSWQQPLEVEAGRPQVLDTVELRELDGRLSVVTVPAGAQVTVDSLYPGLTPLAFPLSSGEPHTVVLFKSGHKPVTRTVRLDPSEKRVLNVKLTPQIGIVELVAEPSDAQLEVDGRSAGPANQRLELLAVAHKLQIHREGYVSRTLSVEPLPSFPQRVSVKLQTEEAYKKANLAQLIETAGGQTLQLVEPGSFVMGARRGEPGRRPNETLRAVELTRSYYLAVNEITNREFREFDPKHRSPAFAGIPVDADDLPVSSVSWENAARFCNWLSKRESLPPAYTKSAGSLTLVKPVPAGYRLPTEAEWAWAARFGGGRWNGKYPWGDQFPPGKGAGNYADMSGAGVLANALPGYRDGFAAAAPVGSGSPNALGLFDVGGNVAEWMNDFYFIYRQGNGRSPVLDPTGPAEGRHHVIRGSSWRHATASELRLSFRDYSDGKREDVGFRIARYVE